MEFNHFQILLPHHSSPAFLSLRDKRTTYFKEKVQTEFHLSDSFLSYVLYTQANVDSSSEELEHCFRDGHFTTLTLKEVQYSWVFM